ncbi:hypothetical protein [Halococcus sediminicola]|uniref:hypothetical protein n=1 Tax=Halococcus sediminicola TaxID=1264579 RepID=UPI0006794308|nr:hypothetical protein [Halococcus sediminicola]
MSIDDPSENVVVEIQIKDESDSFDLFNRYSQNLQIVYHALQSAQNGFIVGVDQEILIEEVQEFENGLLNEEVTGEDIDSIISTMAKTGFLREIMLKRNYYTIRRSHQEPLTIKRISKNSPTGLMLLAGFGLITAATIISGYLYDWLVDEEVDEEVVRQQIDDLEGTVERAERITGERTIREQVIDSDDD